MSSYAESSDEFYGVVSDSGILMNEGYRNDAKLRKRCAVVITPTKEILQYERKRDEMYNEILIKQRRKLELRTLAKQREKERRRLSKEKREQTQSTDKGSTATAAAINRDRDKPVRRKSRNYAEIFMSSESEYETNFKVRTRRQRQKNVQDLQQPLNIEIATAEAEATTTSSLLSQIDAHLNNPVIEKANNKRIEAKELQKQQHQQQQQNKPPEEQAIANAANATNDNDINQKTCDIDDQGQQTKMRELNLLADIAQHLSPYQLDLPQDLPRTPSPAPDPTPTPPPPTPKEKVTVTEHLIIKSSGNLLQITQSELAINDEQEQQTATASYAHEPKLNTAAILKSSPPKQNKNQNQQNNTPLEHNDNDSNTLATNNVRDKIKSPSIQTDETLEQILEESISVLKSVTSPFNSPNECTSPAPVPAPAQTATTIPLLISNVESLNHFKANDTTSGLKQKPAADKEHLLTKETTHENSEMLVVTANGLIDETQTNEKTKDVVTEQTANVNRNEPANILSSTILNNTVSSLNLTVETETPYDLKVPSLMSAELSDISLESEISKHLPDIADPSPVVTDMSDNSNESCVSKTFALETPIIDNTTEAAGVPLMSLPDLSLVMPSIPPAATAVPTNQPDFLERNFNNLNSTLNTPTKLAEMTREEEAAANPLNDLNTPIKFGLQPELDSHNTPLKNALEPENDSNVTKFLDLILNKTVTDAESETRDKIIKELNALTADSTATPLDTSETVSNNEITQPLVAELPEDSGHDSMSAMDSVLANESPNLGKTLEEEGNNLKEQEHITIDSLKSQNSADSHIEKENTKPPTTAAENAAATAASPDPQKPSANNELNHPPKEDKAPAELLNDSSTTTALTITSSSPNNKIKASAIKQTFEIKCRVRLKRLNMEYHCKSSKKQTWMAVPITKPEQPDKSANNDMTNCDNMTETTSFLKKPCLKTNNNNKRASDELENKAKQGLHEAAAAPNAADVTTTKRQKLEVEQSLAIESTPTATATTQQPPQLQTTTAALAAATTAAPLNNTAPTKSKSKTLKTVTFDLSNLNEELRDSTSNNHKHKSKNHAATIAAGALGCYLKNSRPPRKLPDNTLRAAETLQLFVNTINDSTRTPPPAEFNKKRSPIKNKCIAEDETPRPPPASTLMGTPPCKKVCPEKSRSQISSSKCKDQLVSSLATASISTITSDITTARIYTSSPLDQTLPEYDDNVDTVADSELILPNTTGSLRRKIKRPKKSLTRPEPVDDISTDEISNQPECNGEDDTDAVADNEDDVFAEELLPIPAANEHILEEIVSARPSHIGSGTVIRDDYMNIEATATVPVYLFNDESRDLATPEPIQSSGDTTNVVDSSSYLNSTSTSATHNVMASATASTTSSLAMGNLEKSMLSPSEHEVSSTQETFYQTPTKSKQTADGFGEKSTTSKDKIVGGSSTMTSSQKQKTDESNFQNKDDQTSSTTGLLQNNQVDTTNHSPEMCTLALTPTTTTSSAMASNRKIRKASTHDEILFNELQQQQQQHQQAPNKRKNSTTTTTTFCAESTSGDNNSKTNKLMSNNLDDAKSNRSLAKEDKYKKLLKAACKRDKTLNANELQMGLGAVDGVNIAGGGGGGGGGGGSSPSTTTIINEEKVSRSKRKKQKSSKSNKLKSHSERSTKIVLKASKLAAHVPTANPLVITIPKSRLLRPPATPTGAESPAEDAEEQNDFLDIPNAKLFTEKEKEKDKATIPLKNNDHQQHFHHHQHQHQHNAAKKEWHQTSVNVSGKSKRTQSPLNTMSDIGNIKSGSIVDTDHKEVTRNANTASKEKTSGAATIKNTLPEIANLKTSNTVKKQTKEVIRCENSTTAAITAHKEKSSSTDITKKKVKISSNSSSNNTTNNTTCNNNSNNHNKNNSNNNSNDKAIFVKDKYDLIKSKDKPTNEQHEHIEKLKDKANSQLTKTTTTTTSSPSTTRLHKSSNKKKLQEKHKPADNKSATQTTNVSKINMPLSSNNKALNSSTPLANSAGNVVNKHSTSKTSKTSYNSSGAAAAASLSSLSASSQTNAILKSKTNLATQSLNTNAATAGSSHNISPTSTSTSASASASSSPSVTIATNHVRKKLKTK